MCSEILSLSFEISTVLATFLAFFSRSCESPKVQRPQTVIIHLITCLLGGHVGLCRWLQVTDFSSE